MFWSFMELVHLTSMFTSDGFCLQGYGRCENEEGVPRIYSSKQVKFA